MRRRLLSLLPALALVAAAPAAHAAVAQKPWPPADGPGTLFVHFGEEHINDADGPTLLPAVIDQTARYQPRLVTLSGDKANDGKADQFALWQQAFAKLDEAGVPYLAGAGNHDRTAPPGVPGGTIGLFGGTLPDSFDTYKSFFAGRPYPWGDGEPYPGIGPAQRPQADPDGAAATYTADVGDVRWIFLDNSCWSLSGCDAFQARADGGSDPQLAYLERQAREGTAAGKTVFVVMHIPTRDPRDQDHTDFTAREHVMGKGTSPDNRRFEEIARETGVDGVFVGHIKGQFEYGADGVPYFVDGGAGGELYTEGPVGTDHGYWHGFRLIRVDAGRVTTDTVPIFVADGLRIEGPDTVRRGEMQLFEGFGRQPVFNDPAKVEALELRDPAPIPKGGGRAQILGLPLQDVAYGAPLLLLIALLPLAAAPAGRRRLAAAGGAVALIGAGGAGTLAIAQQSEPTATPKEALPSPARIWTSSNPQVLAPVASQDDDPRRDAARQTEDGRFRAVCPGRTWLSLTSGFEERTRLVTVPSEPGRVVRSVSRRRTMRAGRVARVARVRLAQPAQVTIRVKRGSRVVAQRRRACAERGASLRWSARNARPGRYTVEVRVSSDRKPVIARHRLRVLPRR